MGLKVLLNRATTHCKNEICSSGEKSKARTTGMASITALGKMLLFVVGKVMNLHCFKYVK